jgi:hypothetical protein
MPGAPCTCCWCNWCACRCSGTLPARAASFRPAAPGPWTCAAAACCCTPWSAGSPRTGDGLGPGPGAWVAGLASGEGPTARRPGVPSSASAWCGAWCWRCWGGSASRCAWGLCSGWPPGRRAERGPGCWWWCAGGTRTEARGTSAAGSSGASSAPVVVLRLLPQGASSPAGSSLSAPWPAAASAAAAAAPCRCPGRDKGCGSGTGAIADAQAASCCCCSWCCSKRACIC